MSRAENVTRALELRERGYLLREIAEELGASYSVVQEWVADPDGSKRDARKLRYVGTCLDCGAPCDGFSGAVRCASCSRTREAEISRVGHRLMAEDVVEMWAAGAGRVAIGAALGWSSPKAVSVLISQLRAEGYDLPHRRPQHIVNQAALLAARRAA